ncbi:hypothetical protein Pint_26840 [Pistacia integerrima]|uniref:Uncharacterized protein n=1 Tax=Pistacia integerrima TaxID=434235 RepID=A0ACC0YMD2_9ROSI|nr:hypothetical protein Pint_26840 [Pistacia integerrima]
MAMKILSGSCSSDLSSLFRGVFYINRTRLASPEEVFSCQGIIAARTVKKSDHFIDHLISRLHSAHKCLYLVGRELTTLQIRDTINPYLQSLLEEHGNFMVDLVKNFPTKPIEEKPTLPVCRFHSNLDSKKPEVVSHIRLATHKYPSFDNYSSERKIILLVEFLLDLGVAKLEIPKILVQRPHLCGHSISVKIIPIMYLEDMGVDKKQQAKVIFHFPRFLSHSRQKVQAVVNFLHELGLSSDSIGKVLTRFPRIVCYSMEDNLQPTVQYFKRLGA